MRVTFRELDFWLMKGFGGILNMVHTRVTQFPFGFSKVPRRLMAQETRRMDEFNEYVQANGCEEYPEDKTDLVCLDNWFIQAFTGLDQFLLVRADEAPKPISENNLHSIEDHIKRLQAIVAKERRKWQNSNG